MTNLCIVGSSEITSQKLFHKRAIKIWLMANSKGILVHFHETYTSTMTTDPTTLADFSSPILSDENHYTDSWIASTLPTGCDPCCSGFLQLVLHQSLIQSRYELDWLVAQRQSSRASATFLASWLGPTTREFKTHLVYKLSKHTAHEMLSKLNTSLWLWTFFIDLILSSCKFNIGHESQSQEQNSVAAFFPQVTVKSELYWDNTAVQFYLTELRQNRTRLQWAAISSWKLLHSVDKFLEARKMKLSCLNF